MKKISLILAAFALVLGISQCRKQETPMGKLVTQDVTFTSSFNNGAKFGVDNTDPAALKLTWDAGDIIKVTDDATPANVSTLTCTEVTDDGKSGTFTGTITCQENASLTFSYNPIDYLNQDGSLQIYLEGTSPYQKTGIYELEMTMPCAVLKLNVSALGTSGLLTIAVGVSPVASVTDVSLSEGKAVFVAVPANEAPTEYTISCGGKIAKEPWPALVANTFYTLDNGTGSGSGDAIVIVPAFEFIDLGLPSGTLWANMNLGAKSIKDDPTCCGDYYAWSKIETYYDQASSNPPVNVEWKANYSEGYNMVYGFPYTKYNDTDGLKRLELVDDVANAVLGDGAQIPSVAQWNELIQNCDKSKTNNEGYGYVTLTSRFNGNSIILPAGGFFSDKVNSNYGNFGVYYMTSELSTTDISLICSVWCGANEELQCSTISRFNGVPVRAVKPRPVPAGFVDLGLSVFWAESNLDGYYQFGATTPNTGNWWNTVPYYVSGFPNDDDDPIIFSKYQSVGQTLEASDDAAAVAGKGRIPSVAEWDELRTQCDWDWNGSGCTLTSKINGNSISLPANGNNGSFANERGYYWANEVGNNNYDAHRLYFDANGDPGTVSDGWNYRKEAFGIRPVHD